VDEPELEKRISDRNGAVLLAVRQVFSPEHTTSQFGGAVQYKGVPPINVVATVQLNGLNQIGFGWVMDCPSGEIPNYFLSFLARDPELSRSRRVELSQNLKTDSSGVVVSQASDKFN
jgi:hypothetical protein